MLEIGASGSVGGEGGNILAYPASVRRTGKGDGHVIWCSEASCHSSE
jgi:hypothetical protein